MHSIVPLYNNACPKCNGKVSANEIIIYGFCSKCNTTSNSPLDTYKEFIVKSETEFAEFFQQVTGFKAWGAQRYWLKRILRGENTVLIAPTGMGKSTLLIAYSLYAASKGKRTLYVVPTKPLLNQVHDVIMKYISKTSIHPDQVIIYQSSSSRKKRLEIIERIKRGNYYLLIITSSFLTRNYSLILQQRFDIIIVDDVDSLMKTEKSVYNLIKLLGYSEQAIELAKKKINLLWRIIVGKVSNRDISNLVKEYLEVDKQLEEENSNPKSQLIIASATGKTRGVAGKVLKELLRVDISSITIYGRDVTDSYLVFENRDDLTNSIIDVVRKLGKGCIIYVSPKHPYREIYENIADRLVKELSRNELKIHYAKPKTIKLFINGEVDAIIGYSTYYGSSVRGIDAPKHIKYVIFLGVPVFTTSIENLLIKINMLVRVLVEISSITGNSQMKKLAIETRGKTLTLTPSEKKLISLCLQGKIPEESITTIPRLMEIYNELKETYKYTLEEVKKLLDAKKIVEIGTITLIKKEKEYLAVIPDVMTYIQASGRTSRLLGNRMTHGLSIIIEHIDLKNTVNGLETKLRFYNRDIVFKKIENIQLERELETLIMTRSEENNSVLSYRSILVVVESPTKAKSIARFFGKPLTRSIRDINVYSIPVRIDNEILELNLVATRGHIYELSVNVENSLYGVVLTSDSIMPVYSTIRKCRVCGTQFLEQEQCPKCKSTLYADSHYTISVLRKIASEVDEVYIATDPDIEGEKIAYDVYMALYPYNRNIYRIELHEITSREFIKAIKNKRSINKLLVEAEIYRRILDRLVGFTLSEKIQLKYGSRYLGIGRVQAPVLGLVIDRYREYLMNKCKLVVLETSKPVKLKFNICIEKNQRKLVEKLKELSRIELVKVFEEVVEVLSKPPYTTDELLLDASKHGIPTDTTMKLVQELFEAGLITYHRTDSTYISSTGIEIAREYLSSRNLLNYFKPSHWGIQGTHEAIRPVYPLDSNMLLRGIEEGVIAVVVPLTGLHFKLYDMIFTRFITSQVKSFKAIKTHYLLVYEDRELMEVELFTDIVENGFNLIQPVKIYPDLKNTDRVKLVVDKVKVMDFSKSPLYSEGELVQLMKKHGIGRPSTYTKTITNLKRHGYIFVSEKKRKIIPTKRGISVYDYLVLNYPDLVSVTMTRRMESLIDSISTGRITSASAVRELILELLTRELVNDKLVLSFDLYNYVGFGPASNHITTY